MDFTKLQGDVSSFVLKQVEGDWDSKLESKIDTSIDRSNVEYERIKKALYVLEQANVLDPDNLKMLQRCTEVKDN